MKLRNSNMFNLCYIIRIVILLLLIPFEIQAGKTERSEDYSLEIKTSMIHPQDISSDEISKLVQVVNEAYLVGEEGICLPDMKRTSEKEITELIKEQRLLGLKVGDDWKGCIQVRRSEYDETNQSGLFGMLVVADEPKLRGKGYGTLLVDEAEKWAKSQGYKNMMLELIKPKDWSHPHKERLETWYIKRGYLPIDTRPFPHPEVLEIKDYTFTIFKKIL